MQDCFQHLARILAEGPAVLATVTHVRGSVPREVGAKMVIDARGQIFGTIGGGAGEAKVIQQAIEVLQTGQNQSVEIDLTGTPQRLAQGICGGKMQVWLSYWQGETARLQVQQILDRLNRGQTTTLITPLNGSDLPYWVDQAQPISAAFVETIAPPPILLIVGAGHVGEQLAKVADLIGFQVVIQDDRPEWGNPQRYPQAQVCNDSIHRTIESLAQHQQLYAALVTRGYQYDLEALQSLLNRELPCQYIGMIGSEKRVRQVYQAIEQLGLPHHQLQSIHAPIGLDIGALTPAEIAISIGAELILVRRGGTGRPLKLALALDEKTIDWKAIEQTQDRGT